MKIKTKNILSKNNLLAILASLISFILLMSISLFYIHNFYMRVKEDEENKVAISFYSLNDEIIDFKNQNVSLVSGFSAYVQLNETIDDEEVYQYLDFLLRDHLDDIRNIGVFEDTTIHWVYPLEGNEGAIGVDLTTIPEQREEVLRVKNNLETLFVGPINLIQGGEAFIIRMPLLKEARYWGMVSIVLKAENAFHFVEEHASQYQVDYLITSANQPEEVIYGDRHLLEMSPMKFTTDYTIGDWDIYAVPKGEWDYRINQIVGIFIAALIFSLSLSVSVYSLIKKYDRAVHDKVELEKKYILDPFTKIYTRAYFNLRLKEEVSACLRYKRPIAMIYFDLDHFKEVNDTHGHAAGDDVLLEVVDKVNKIIRTEDIFARWGGDEFILLLPNTDLKGASFVAERVREGIENTNLNQNFGVTASVGYSEWKHQEYVESWFMRTDHALYVSKETGKNKVTASDHHTEKNILVKVEWDKSSNSGCQTIDKEHEAILERCNLIVESALKQSAFDEIVRNVQQVIIEMENHFNDEIEILKERGYPDVDKHKKIHENLLLKTRELFDKTMQNEVTAVEFFSFLLLTVVEGHFKNEDVKYFSYLNDN